MLTKGGIAGVGRFMYCYTNQSGALHAAVAVQLSPLLIFLPRKAL